VNFPDGSLLFVEHVRSDDPGLARWQDRLHGAWRSFADGCNCNRQTADLLRGVHRPAPWRGTQIEDVHPLPKQPHAPIPNRQANLGRIHDPSER